jgi:hypothetical protein
MQLLVNYTENEVSDKQIHASYHWWGAMCEANKLGLVVFCIDTRKRIHWEE